MSTYQSFETEHYCARYEFSVKYLLAASDCESLSIGKLLKMSGGSLEQMGEVSLGYTETQGAPWLREAISETYESVDAGDVIVLGSPIEGVYLTMRTLLAAGDEVIVLTPSYDALRNLPEDLAGTVHYWSLTESKGEWSLDLDALGHLLNDKTRLVVADFPHNPTGYLPTGDEFAELVRMVDVTGAWLYHDEIFRGLEHGERPTLRSAADLSECTIVLGGLSKTHGLPGLRAGWLVVRDEAVRQQVMNTKMYTSICPPAPVEYLTLQVLLVSEQLAALNRVLIASNLAIADTFFNRHSDLFTYRRPMAGPVALVGINVASATVYCDSLVEAAGVMLLPSPSLGIGDRHVRFGFGRLSFPEALGAFETYVGGESV